MMLTASTHPESRKVIIIISIWMSSISCISCINIEPANQQMASNRLTSGSQQVELGLVDKFVR